MAKPLTEEQKQRKRDLEKERRRKIKDHPVKWAEHQRKEKEKYQRQKEQKIRLSIKDMTPRDQRRKRKEWKEYSKRSRSNKKKDVNKNTVVKETSKRKKEVKRKVKSNESNRRCVRRHREKEKLVSLVKKYKQEVNRYRKRCFRYEQEQKLNAPQCSESPTTPFTKVNASIEVCLRDPKKVEEVKKKLLLGEVIKHQLQDSFSSLKSEQEKQVFKKLVEGKVVKKYKLKTQCAKYFKFRVLKANSTKTLLQVGRKYKSRINKQTDVKKKVESFYQQDNNSRLCPGKKDYITKKKITKQKRLLLNTMKNLYLSFSKSNPDIKISYSLFCRWRPFWVKIMKISERETCKCLVHANMELMVNCLFSNKIIISKTPSQIIQDICCDVQKEDCLLRKCKDCKDSVIFYNDCLPDENLQYLKWVNLKQSYFDKKSRTTKYTNKIAKTPILIKFGEFKKKFEQELILFMAHKARITHQYIYITKLKESLGEDEVLIHCDFSENYNLKYSEEVQSFHFGGSRQQISMHTVVTYTKSGSECFSTLSENLEHGPASIWAHLEPILMQYSNRGISKLHFLSDSPSAQYRNKTMFSFLAHHVNKYIPGVNEITWNYQEAGHGKGAPDGIGGVCKRTADRIVAEGKDIAHFKDLLKILKENCPGVTFFEIKSDEIEKIRNIINNTPAKVFVGTMNIKQVKTYVDTFKVWLRRMSCSCEKFCSHYELGVIMYPDHNSFTEASNVSSSSSDSSVTMPNLPNTKIRYEDIYASDDEHAAGSSCFPKSVNKKNIKAGTYVLVSMSNQNKKDHTNYKYIGVCQGELDEEEVLVTFLKIVSKKQDDPQLFKLDDADKSYITEEQIIDILPEPNLILKGNRIFYTFKDTINVFEKV